MSKPTFYIINSWQTFVADLNPLMHCVPLEYICLQSILVTRTYTLHALHLFSYFHHTCFPSSCIHNSTWSQVTFEVSRNILVIRNNLVVFIMGFALSWMTLLPGSCLCGSNFSYKYMHIIHRQQTLWIFHLSYCKYIPQMSCFNLPEIRFNLLNSMSDIHAT